MDPFKPVTADVSAPTATHETDTEEHHSDNPAPTPQSSAVGSVQTSPDSSPPLVLNDPYKPKTGWLDKIINGMSWYGLELALSVVGLTVATAVINYGIYALFNYLKGIENPLASQYVGEFSIWVAATMIVWLPLAIIYYLRARAEASRYPETRERLVHKLFVGYFLFNVVLAIAATAFSVIYALVRNSIGIDDQAGDTAVRVVIPGIIAAAVNSGLFWAYAKHAQVSRKLFAMVFSALGIVVTIILLVMSVSNVQGNNRDQKAAEDLSAINNEITSYYGNMRTLPSDLNKLDGLKTETKNRLSRYEYKKEQGARYQLCATFVTDTQKQQGYDASGRYSSEYKTYASFGTHGTGEKCFKLSASYSSLYDSYLNGSDSSLFDSPSDSSSY